MAADYGRDLSCTSRLVTLPYPDGTTRTRETLSVDLATVSTGRTLLAEALVRRLSTTRGQLIDDPNYGYSLLDLINSGVTQADIPRIATEVGNELKKDTRVQSARCPAVFDGLTLTLTLTVVDGKGPFKRVLSVDQLGIKDLGAAA